MPPIGMLIGGVDFKDLAVVLQKATETAPAVTLNYGSFIQVVFDFLIVAFAVFMLIKGLNMAKRKKENAPAAPAPEPAPTKEEILLTEIRDLLKK
jgi:large conductance mechanosensitive channel